MSDHWFNPNIDVRKSGEGGRRGSRSSSRRRRRRRRGGGVGIPIPLFFSISSVFNTGFQALAKSPLASNFLLLSSLNGFLAKSDLLRVSLDPLCFFTSTLRALSLVEVAIPLIDDMVSWSFSPIFPVSFIGLSLFNRWVGSKESVASTSKLSLTTSLLSLWYSNTTLGTSKNKKQN
ncbi:hypothetical protein [Mycoplasmoides genitalium]